MGRVLRWLPSAADTQWVYPGGLRGLWPWRGAGPKTPEGSSLQGPAHGTSRLRLALPADMSPPTHTRPLPRVSRVCGWGGWVFIVEPAVHPPSTGAHHRAGSHPSCPAALPCPVGRISTTWGTDGNPRCELGQASARPAAPLSTSGLDVDTKNDGDLPKGLLPSNTVSSLHPPWGCSVKTLWTLSS